MPPVPVPLSPHGTANAPDRPPGRGPAPSGPARVRADDGVWTRVLDEADLVWHALPRAWDEGPFLGNARLGSLVYAEPGSDAVRFTVQHSEVQDHRPEFGALFGLARLPVGHFTLRTAGAVTAVDWRLGLQEAELAGTLTTTRGTLALRAVVHDKRSLLAVEVTPTGGEHAFSWTFHPAESVSPRAAFKPVPEGYTGHPPATVEPCGRETVAVQKLLGGGEYATAWTERTHGEVRVLSAHVAQTYPAPGAREAALDAVRRAATLAYGPLTADHRAGWRAYYRKSFLSVPDARLQSFYWIQLYKIASAARADAPVMATCGPWLEPTPWPGVWWNLNVQLEYWMIHGSNHLELDAPAVALSAHRQRLTDQLEGPYRPDSAGLPRTTDMYLDGGYETAGSGCPIGVPGEQEPTPEVGNLLWALHNVWLSYRHTMDRGILEDTVFPLLRRAVSYYLHFLRPGPDGRLHLPPTFSPEYGEVAPDCTYDLQLLRWGCATLVESADLLGVDDPLAPRWHEVLDRLTPYPVDENGLMIGAGVPFARSHRHYSHLLAVYPLYELTWENPAHRDLIERSLRHWIGFEGALQGYSFTGAASIAAQMGRGDEAAGHLTSLLDRFVRPNTMYKESGPVIETPLSAAQSLHDMVCQSWGGVIRVFPALPDAWQDVTVHDFRTQGAFLLSAARQGGVTRWIRLRSEAGAPCVVRTGMPGPVTVTDGDGRELPRTDLPDGSLRLGLEAGREAYIRPAPADGAEDPGGELAVRAVRPRAAAPRWGLPGHP
ncbi:glycosyl hydrolase family 95 catalytic domain-containing protein [uncultured Streptomyces sp.]|uniref:glycosyl hydrolase family 95 catalytic domain-containing protein n=1 Tax=uncultured Streptomyces sp. TaxID=174707 RepID=UPI0026370991|nr:Tat pathway signal sequence domain protein [uncultured Streptomyces sp.]